MKILRRFSIWLVPVLLMASCGDDDPAPNKKPLLVGKQWVVTRYLLDGADVTEDWDPCELDNIMVFADDDTFLADMGELLCEEEETDTEGTWVFKANQTVLSMTGYGESAMDWKIKRLTDTTLIISRFEPLFDVEVTIEMTPL